MIKNLEQSRVELARIQKESPGGRLPSKLPMKSRTPDADEVDAPANGASPEQ